MRLEQATALELFGEAKIQVIPHMGLSQLLSGLVSLILNGLNVDDTGLVCIRSFGKLSAQTV